MTGSLVYVANARLPTEKAHGHAIVKMCEAYANAGLDVELWHPRRRQDPRIAGTSVFEYYGVPPTFGVRTLANVDVIAAESRFPPSIFPLIMGAHDFIWAAVTAARAATNTRFSLCHTRDPAVAWWMATTRIPTVLEIHDPPAGPRRALLRRVGHLSQLRGVVALTTSTRDALVQLGIDPRRIIVLGSGVDLAAFTAGPAPGVCRAALGLPTDRAIVGYIGRFEALGAEKGLMTAVRAVGSIRRRFGVAPLLVCVGGPMDRVCDYLAAGIAAGGRADDFRFVDHVPSRDVPGWIRACDVGVIPSPRSDHFTKYSSPMKLFEFMASGVPVVASNLPALRETVVHESNGWLVTPESPDDLAAALELLIEKPELRRRLSHRARTDVEGHTWSRRAATILARFDNGCALQASEPP
jgi:glycosyltransferase involved in cell wall biosynthesis